MPSAPLFTADVQNANPIPFPDPKSPFTHHQQFALEALRQGKGVTAIMDELGYNRQTFYDWRNANPAFKLATDEARDEFRGVVADCVHDLQQSVHVLLDDCIRTDRVPLNLRLRSAALFLRYVHSETLLPRRLADLANSIPPAAPGVGPASPISFPKPSEPAPGTPAPNATESYAPAPGTPAPCEAETQAPQPSESNTQPAAASEREPIPNLTLLHTENFNETVRSVRFEPPAPTPAQPIPAPILSQAAAASPAEAPPKPSPSDASSPTVTAPSPAVTLSHTWLSAHFLHQHESPKRFEALLNNHIRAYQPATAAEELLVFRITQKSWLLRRLETWERVIADSQVAAVRRKHANATASNATASACLALSFLEAKDTSQTRFHERTAKLRQEHEAALDRLTAKLETQQLRREAAHLRAQRENPLPGRRPLRSTDLLHRLMQ